MRIQPSYNQSFICLYSFQAQEHDDEVKGDGNSVNFEFRMHDPRVGRFFAIDPLVTKYPHNSPYAFSENILINSIEFEGLEHMEVTIQPDKNNSKLSIVTVKKIQDKQQNVPMMVTYIFLDPNGKNLSTENLNNYKPGSVEEYAMNEKWGNFSSRTEAMNEKDKIVNGIRVPGIHKSNLSGKTLFEYDLKILFASNKAEICNTEMSDKEYYDAIAEIDVFKKLLIDGIPIPKQTDRFDFGKMTMVVNGETDSQLSSPPFPDEQGSPCGNACLGKKRAENLLQEIVDAHPNDNFTRNFENTGKVKSGDRNSTVFLVPH